MGRSEVSVSEVLSAHLEQIERLNPKVNAICTLRPEQALQQAAEADRKRHQTTHSEPLRGLPIAIKDLVRTEGIRTTFGSLAYADYVPEQDDLCVQRLKSAGAIVIGKSNTPEFGAGSNTFNAVFGKTRNPYDLEKTCGGSSGGGAAALACGMVPIADGSDLGGSLRNPPSFNNVVGLRPSPGRIPQYPNAQPWDSLPVLGAMARNVADVGLMLSAMAGADSRDPISFGGHPGCFRQSLDGHEGAAQLAWSPNLGQFPVQREVTEVIESALPRFADLGCTVVEEHPDFSGAAEVFQVLRAHSFAANWSADLAAHRSLLKDTVVWNIERGQQLTGEDVSRAQGERAALYHRVRGFFDRYDFLLLPVSQVVPFSVDLEWVEAINDEPMKTYIDWMQSCSLITLTGHPAISVPCGFTREGLPVGLQIVGPFRAEMKLLRFAHAFEQLTQAGQRRPEIAR
jgi:amidase